eukprot:CAMPEP_0181249970 /NCGR_PEP_ID=MMETSP1096-20121128/46055_1 /TAXON_ID=156174 ORGANISM="Chrysochromulina ericina, Strain CCMP281" /NCGR_SAMPLE_ID=MMETSP1096 /ASSEMBLY_ACC=CAM_ASM_000453 /LENGTH=124 /DNA_ID=CAMNT_0023347377 /DNA_START=609 /DNA_END=980 /DNA_ORIENTATION=-
MLAPPRRPPPVQGGVGAAGGRGVRIWACEELGRERHHKEKRILMSPVPQHWTHHAQCQEACRSNQDQAGQQVACINAQLSLQNAASEPVSVRKLGGMRTSEQDEEQEQECHQVEHESGSQYRCV